MPAIDPARLSDELESLRALSGDPARIAGRTRDLIEIYSDQARSPELAVPGPVLRSLRAVLREMGNPLPIAEALWRNGLPDSRLLAAGLLEAVEKPGVAAVAEDWAGQNVAIEIVRELGERGLAGWRRADPSAFTKQIQSWLGERKRRSRVLAIYALRARARDPEFEDLPSVLELLNGGLSAVRGEVREALILLFTALSEVAPQETASFLDEQESSPLVRTLKARLNVQTAGVV